MKATNLKLTLLSLFLGSFLAINAQTKEFTFGVMGGATYVDWEDNISRGANKTFQPAFDFFAGVQAAGKIMKLNNLSWNARFFYKESSIWEGDKYALLKVDDISLGLGPRYRYKKLEFGLNPSFSYVVRKRKVDNTPNTGINPEKFKNIYLSLSGSLAFSVTSKLDFFVERAFLNTSIHDSNRANRFGLPTNEIIRTFKRWTLFGVRYRILNE